MSRQELENFLIRTGNGTPITEQRNALSTNIDLAVNGREIVDILHRTDHEIFAGWQGSAGLKFDQEIIEKIAKLSKLLSENLNDRAFKLILSGCGTSGRLAFLCAKTFNAYFRTNVCECIIAGDEFALCNSVEVVEDKPKVGRDKLKMLVDGDVKFVFVGITCGLSAPFVGGQLDFCLSENSQRCLGWTLYIFL